MISPTLLRLLLNPTIQLKLIMHIALKWEIDGHIFGGTLDIDSFDERLRSVQKSIKSLVVHSQHANRESAGGWLSCWYWTVVNVGLQGDAVGCVRLSRGTW
jgi:hypothetical protein